MLHSTEERRSRRAKQQEPRYAAKLVRSQEAESKAQKQTGTARALKRRSAQAQKQKADDATKKLPHAKKTNSHRKLPSMGRTLQLPSSPERPLMSSGLTCGSGSIALIDGPREALRPTAYFTASVSHLVVVGLRWAE